MVFLLGVSFLIFILSLCSICLDLVRVRRWSTYSIARNRLELQLQQGLASTNKLRLCLFELVQCWLGQWTNQKTLVVDQNRLSPIVFFFFLVLVRIFINRFKHQIRIVHIYFVFSFQFILFNAFAFNLSIRTEFNFTKNGEERWTRTVFICIFRPDLWTTVIRKSFCM